MKIANSKRDNFLKKHYLTEFHDQFVRFSGIDKEKDKRKNLNEWSFLPSSLDEDGEDDDDMMNNVPNGNAPMGNQNPTPAMNNGDMGGGAPNNDAEPSSNMPSSPSPDNNQLPGADGNAPMGDSNQPIPSPTDNNAPMMGGDSSMEEDEDELDITDLTDAQEKMNKKINTVGKELSNSEDSISQLMVTLNKINDIIKSNNEKIENLENEIKKRNPTPLEKLDLRSVDSSTPYNIRPNDFWGNKLNTLPNYDVYNENDPNKTEKEYVITTDDINDSSTMDISDSFDDIDIDLEKIFGLR